MKPGTVSSQLKELSKAGIKKVFFSGGEPLLYQKEIISLLKEAKANGLRTSIISNGFWATSSKEAFQTMKELKKSGLNTLKISIGPFHQEFTPIENVKRILKERKKFPEIQIILYLDKTRNEMLFEIANLLSRQKKVPVAFSEVVPFGRAKNLLEKELFYRETMKEKCPYNIPVLSPNQDAFICCFGQLKGRSSSFFIGNASKEPLKEIIKKYQKSKLVKHLQSKGPHALVKELEKRKIKPLKPNKKKKFVFLCHYCIEKLSSYKKGDVTNTVNELI